MKILYFCIFYLVKLPVFHEPKRQPFLFIVFCTDFVKFMVRKINNLDFAILNVNYYGTKLDPGRLMLIDTYSSVCKQRILSS